MRKRRTMFNYLQSYWPSPNSSYWRDAEEIAQKIVVSRRRDLVSPSVGRVRLVKLRVEGGKGVEYYMTIEVTGKDGTNTSYDVKVYRLPSDLPYEIASFDKTASSEIKTQSYVSDGSNVSDEKASSSRKGKKRAALSDGKSSSIITMSGKIADEKASNVSDDNEGNTELLSEVTGRLRTRGFYILLEQIRSERPTLSYSKARKMASSTWGKLPEDEKMTFMGEAAKKVEAMRC